MNKNIGIDFDEVLSETLKGALTYNKHIFNGLPIDRKDVTDYFLYRIPKYKASEMDAKLWFNGYLLGKGADTLQAVLGAKHKLKELKKKGYSLFVVTGRPERLKYVTIKWINKHFPGIFDDVLFANQLTKDAVTKASLCKKHGIHIMIEDDLYYAKNIAAAGIKVYLFDKPRNQQYDSKIDKNIVKVKGRKDIIL